MNRIIYYNLPYKPMLKREQSLGT